MSPNLIAKELERFDKKFPQLAVIFKHDEPLDNVTADVRNFLSSSITRVLTAFVDEVEKTMPENKMGCMQESCSMGGGMGDVNKGVCRICHFEQYRSAMLSKMREMINKDV